jgi:hypothetical protein
MQQSTKFLQALLGCYSRCKPLRPPGTAKKKLLKRGYVLKRDLEAPARPFGPGGILASQPQTRPSTSKKGKEGGRPFCEFVFDFVGNSHICGCRTLRGVRKGALARICVVPQGCSIILRCVDTLTVRKVRGVRHPPLYRAEQNQNHDS